MKKLVVVLFVFWVSLVWRANPQYSAGSCQLSSVWVDRRTREIRDYQECWKQHYLVLYAEAEEISNVNDFCGVYVSDILNRGDVQKMVAKEISWNTVFYYEKLSRCSSLFRQDGRIYR